jgi:DNA-binding LacI/PurR family transcriptional regulator
MRIKLKDIAERANVSLATVSRVLNNQPGVDERTRASIYLVLTHLGYPLPTNGETEITGQRRQIIVATRSIETRQQQFVNALNAEKNSPFYDDFTPLVIDGIEVVTRKLGLRMQIERVHLTDPDPLELSQMQEAGGVIIVGGMLGRAKLVDYLEKADIPFVMVGGHLGDHEINCVLGDYIRSSRQAVQSLAELGHHRIALVNGPPTTTTSSDKLAGYKLAIAEGNLGNDDALIVSATDFDLQAGYSATRQLLSQTRRFTAILYAGDSLAVGGLKALKEVGFDVPRDVSIVGFYNGAIAQFTDPPLTTLHLDRQRLGEIAARRMADLLEKPDDERLRIIVPMQLIVRGSTAPVRD